MADDNGGNAGTSSSTSTATGGTSTGASSSTTGESGQQQQTAYAPPATQADLDRIISDRLARERSRFSDYEDLKAKAAEHDKAVAANQSETEREKAARARAEKEAADAKAQLARYKVASEKGVPAELLAGSTEDEFRTHADQLIAFRGQQGQQTGGRTASYDGGSRTTADGKTDMNAIIRRAAGVAPR